MSDFSLILILSIPSILAMEFHVEYIGSQIIPQYPISAIDEVSSRIYLYGPERDTNTNHKSFTYNLDIPAMTMDESKTDNFISFPQSPISSGYCQFDNHLYYMSSTNTINNLDISNPLSPSSVSKWYIPYLTNTDWITMTCDKINKTIYILQNNNLIHFPVLNDHKTGQINHIQLALTDVTMDNHSSVYNKNKLYVIHGKSTSRSIKIIDIQTNEISNSKVSITDCYDSGLNAFSRNDKIYLFCEDNIKIYDIATDTIQATNDQLRGPRTHASIQIYDIDVDTFRVFVFGGKSDKIQGSLPMEYTIADDNDKVTDEITKDVHDHNAESLDDTESMIPNVSAVHLSIIGGLALFILCILMCNALKNKRGRGPAHKNSKAHKKLIQSLRKEGFVMRLPVPSMDNDESMDSKDDKDNANDTKETNLEFAYNSQEEGVCDAMIDIISD